MHGTHWCALSTAYFTSMNSALTNKVKKKHKSQKGKKKKKTWGNARCLDTQNAIQTYTSY